MQNCNLSCLAKKSIESSILFEAASATMISSLADCLDRLISQNASVDKLLEANSKICCTLSSMANIALCTNLNIATAVTLPNIKNTSYAEILQALDTIEQPSVNTVTPPLYQNNINYNQQIYLSNNKISNYNKHVILYNEKVNPYKDLFPLSNKKHYQFSNKISLYNPKIHHYNNQIHSYNEKISTYNNKVILYNKQLYQNFANNSQTES